MPIYKSISVDSDTHLLIWKIEEPLSVLSEGVHMTSKSQKRLESMKSEIHQKGFMSIRQMLRLFEYADKDLTYDAFGKPSLSDGNCISISHSFDFSALVISERPVGIDVEKQRPKIQRIAKKFIGSESSFLAPEVHMIVKTDSMGHHIRALTAIWSAKEAIYKLYAAPGLSFAKNIHVMPFELDQPLMQGCVLMDDAQSSYDLGCMEFDGYTAVYALPIASW